MLYEGLTAEEWAITLLQKEWVFANCLLAILTLLIVHVGEKIIMNSSRNVFYSKIRLSDRVWVLLNLNFVCLFLLVIGRLAHYVHRYMVLPRFHVSFVWRSPIVGPFSYAALLSTFGKDHYRVLYEQRHVIVFGLNVLSLGFLIEGILVGTSIRKNMVLYFHHIVFFFLVVAFAVTGSLDVLRAGLVLGSLTTWQVFPRYLVICRMLGVRNRTQKVIAFLSFTLGIFTRGVLGPVCLVVILSEKYAAIDPSTWTDIISFVSICFANVVLILIELKAVRKQRKVYTKLIDLARQCVLRSSAPGHRARLLAHVSQIVMHEAERDEKEVSPMMYAQGKKMHEESKRE